MYVWQHSITDGTGVLRLEATLEVRDALTDDLVEIFADENGDVAITNPFSANQGFCRFYAEQGRYTITARDSALERVWENVQLGITLAALPDMTSVLAPIIQDALESFVENVQEQVAALPVLVSFTVLGNGDAGAGIPDTWSVVRTGTGEYTVNVNLDDTNYHVKLTVWDNFSDRVYSAMLTDKTSSLFKYRVRSIHNTASLTDARVDIEVTLPEAIE